jgi:hypothetical protein
MIIRRGMMIEVHQKQLKGSDTIKGKSSQSHLSDLIVVHQASCTWEQLLLWKARIKISAMLLLCFRQSAASQNIQNTVERWILFTETRDFMGFR